MRLKHVKRYKVGSKWYAYHRPTGVRLRAEFGTAEFMLELEALDAKIRRGDAARPGTLGGLISAYRGSDKFARLAPRTRADYQKIFDYLQPLDLTPLTVIDTVFMQRLQDRTLAKRKRRFAIYVTAVLSALFTWGKPRGIIAGNPAKGVETISRPKDLPTANRPWSREECEAVLDAAGPHLKVAIALGMFCGLREGDIISMPRSSYRSGEIERRTGKTGQRVLWPVPVVVRETLAAIPSHASTVLCPNSRGRPWTEGGFRASFFKLIRKLEERGRVGQGLTFHGLRHTVATQLRELGYDPRTIADALGQATTDMAEHYSRHADLREKMTGVVRSLDKARRARK